MIKCLVWGLNEVVALIEATGRQNANRIDNHLEQGTFYRSSVEVLLLLSLCSNFRNLLTMYCFGTTTARTSKFRKGKSRRQLDMSFGSTNDKFSCSSQECDSDRTIDWSQNQSRLCMDNKVQLKLLGVPQQAVSDYCYCNSMLLD